jgi:hypothetical protein
MILTFLDFFRRGLPIAQKKISFRGGPAHFVTYGDGGGDDDDDGLVDNNNALTMLLLVL